MAERHQMDRLVYHQIIAWLSFHSHFFLAHARQTKKEEELLMV